MSQLQLPENLTPLAELALDLRWTWSHAGDALWQYVNPDDWRRTGNAWHVLQDLSLDRARELSRDDEFIARLRRLIEARISDLSADCWCGRVYPGTAPSRIAYFGMEFGLGEALPLYAGGLGVLAGDTLKAASDLGVPLVGVGLLYQEGYFRQIVDADGDQLELYPYNEPASLPIQPVRDAAGGWLHVPLQFPGRTLRLRVWQAKIGRVPLYLLDSNDPANAPADRGITAKLYGGGPETRLMQEIVLGIGGWRMLEALGLEVEICHLNEGHAAFAALERARQFMRGKRTTFWEALAATRAGNVFTSHTPVEAGFDRFGVTLIRKYFPLFRDFLAELGISLDTLLALGRRNRDDPEEPFNMAYLALRTCWVANGVSRLHGEVSRRIFQPLFPRWPPHEVPIGHITNGVHVPSWDSPWSDRIWTEACGKARWRGGLEGLAGAIERLSDGELWSCRAEERRDLVAYARVRLARQLAESGAEPEVIARAGTVLDPNALTLGFARRFTGYKRPDLLLGDPERLARILRDGERPVQIVIAGKAHPDDSEGKRLVQRWVQFAQRPGVFGRVVFLEDYDIPLAQQLVQGVDVWINTPRRPWEACGTSGMKVLVNGGLNLSELDGWWAEAYAPEVGWALGDGSEHDEPEWDAREAEQLYHLLEREIVPLFYARNPQGIPQPWIARIRASMAHLAPRFSANRMLQEYIDLAYIPAVAEFRRRTAQDAAAAKAIAAWQERLRRLWGHVHFGHLAASRERDKWTFRVQAYLGELVPADVRVELYADPEDAEGGLCQEMERVDSIPGSINGYIYQATVATGRAAEAFTPRLLPHHDGVRLPIELPLILWHH